MTNRIDYTARARRIALKHPLLSDIITQITFWIIAFQLYFILVNFISKAIVSLFSRNTVVDISMNILIAALGAIIFGGLLGVIDFYVEKKFRRRSFGLEIVIKTILYIITWITVGTIIKTIGFALEAKFISGSSVKYTHIFFENMGFALSVYTLFMILIISFIKQMNNKFGPGIILPMLLGKYRKPREEERFFMFMDLKSSTSYAEKLGHIKYSKMIQNCFLDLNKVLPKYLAEIYQYVGDEVVLTWSRDEGLRHYNCLKFYFEFQKHLTEKNLFYEKEFGLVPEFKASVHFGKITVAEVGVIKRDIAYHGDTINTASRIQSMCNVYGKNLLLSENVKLQIGLNSKIDFEFVDETILKGKTEKIKLYCVEQILTPM